MGDQKIPSPDKFLVRIVMKGQAMILRAIKSNLQYIKRNVVPTSTMRNTTEIAHHNVDRASLIKSIQIAYRVSAREAEAQVDAAESRSRKLRQSGSPLTRA
jgi:hypothetical protein